MKIQDIRRLYTEQVANLLAQGYTLYPDTMSGSQGEIAHIDLSNGSEILRVLLHEVSDFGGDTYNGHTVITVGKCTDEIREGRYSTIWNNHLEVRSEIRLAKITDSWFTTDEDSRLASEKRYSRWKLRDTPKPRDLGDAFKSVGLRWLRRQPGMKTCKLEHIEWMRLVTSTQGTTHFEIRAKGRTYSIR